MEEAHEVAPDLVSVLSRHLGALYSCPTELQVPAVWNKSNNDLPLCQNSINNIAISARCLIPDNSDQRGDNCRTGNNNAPAVGDAAEATLTASIRELFCRTLHLEGHSASLCTAKESIICRKSRTASCSVNPAIVECNDNNPDGQLHQLREALGTMYDGLHSVRSSQPSVLATRLRMGEEEKESLHLIASTDSEDGRRNAAQLGSTTSTRRHAGLVPLQTPLVESDDGIFLLFACIPFRLTALPQLCRGVKGTVAAGGRRNQNSVDLVLRFVFYQLLTAVDFLHSRNIAVGNLSVRNILLTRHLWVQIAPSIPSLLQGGGGTMASPQVTPKVKAASRTFPPRTDGEEIPKTMRRWQRQQQRQRQRQHLQRSRRLANNPRHPPGEDLPLTYRWVKGFVTNLEYLLAVNAAAGRLPGDRSCHPIVPWVSDLSQPVGEGVCVDGSGKGWRDLTMTKFRLKKGDEQLDKSFLEGKPPHHIPESLSELTLVVYLARRLPVQILKSVVRSELVAEEYPSSIAKMYSWTPDECVPEFYTDPGVFQSSHRDAGGLPDLQVPPWFNGSPEEFVSHHRSLLEGEYVSRNLHRWIDVIFGYCLKGQAAVDNKNVPLPSKNTFDTSSAGGFTLNDKDCPGFTQLFRHPHPPRIIETKRDGSDALRGGEASARQHEDGLRLTSIVTTSPALINEPGYGASLGSGERSPRAAITASSVTETEPCSTHSRSVAASVGKEGEGSGTAGGKGGGASIFGVAFDDYIGEDGVCLPAAPTMTSTVTSGGRTSVEMASSDRGGGGEALASIEEDRRALAFAYDVELRLDPWYGRSRSSLPDSSYIAPASTDISSVMKTVIPAKIRYRGDIDVHGVWGSQKVGKQEKNISDFKAADLLACGCVLAEMCAGEPVLASPNYSAGTTDSGGEGRGRSGWLEAAADLPPALRGAIGALTDADPEQRPSAGALLSTAEPVEHDRETSTRGQGMRRPCVPAPLPAYSKLFPPYMRDVYAFLAALHLEETDNKRLVLAANTLPVLRVPLHAFCLVVPHISTLLEGLPYASPMHDRRKRDGSKSQSDRKGTASRRETGAAKVTATARKLKQENEVENSETTPSRRSSGSVSAESGTEKSATDSAAAAVEVEEAMVLQAWVAVFNLSAARLGPSLTSEVLLPTVMKALEGIRSPKCACCLMDYNIWGVLARGIGNWLFLQHAFPLLLAWLERGIEERISEETNNVCTHCEEKPISGFERIRKTTTISSTNEASRGPKSMYQGEGEFPAARKNGRRNTVLDTVSAASRVQVAAAASISGEVFESVGPALAARYLIPALVDCIGRLTIAAATSSPSACAPFSRPNFYQSPEPIPNNTASTYTATEDSFNDTGPRRTSSAEHLFSEDCCCQGDPASRVLFQHCIGRDASGKALDAGIGEGESLLVLSRPLGDICLSIGTEEVIVPLVLSRLFDQVMPHMEPVLAQGGGGLTSATGFRAVLEVTSLLGLLLPLLCPETVCHFYLGIRPAPSSLANPLVYLEDGTPSPRTGGVGHGEERWATPVAGVGAARAWGTESESSHEARGGCNSVLGEVVPVEVTSIPWLFSSMPLPQPLGGFDLPWSADRAMFMGTGEGVEDSDRSDQGEEQEETCSPAGDGSIVDGEDDTELATKNRQPLVAAEKTSENVAVPSPQENTSAGIDSEKKDDGKKESVYFTTPSSYETREVESALVGGVSYMSPTAPSAPLPVIDTRFPSLPNDSSTTIDSEATEAGMSWRFVCHIEVARLFGATAMGVLGEDGSGEEECGRLLRASEDFFAAFGRSYGGLVFSSPTMVAALRVARELYTPLASVFGLDVMRERVPSASHRMVSWLSKDTVYAKRREAHPASPQETFGGSDREEKSDVERAWTDEESNSRSWGDSLVDFSRKNAAAQSSRSSSTSAGILSKEDLKSSRATHEAGEGSLAPKGVSGEEHACSFNLNTTPSDYGIYISPETSPKSVSPPLGLSSTGKAIDSASTTPSCKQSRSWPRTVESRNVPVVEASNDQGTHQLRLFGRIQQAIMQRLTTEGVGGDMPSSAMLRERSLQPGRRRAAITAATAARSRHDRLQKNTARTSAKCSPTRKGIDSDKRGSTTQGVPAWEWRSKDVLDPLLRPPTSPLPPTPSSANDTSRFFGRISHGWREEVNPRDSAGILEQGDGRPCDFDRVGAPARVAGGDESPSFHDDGASALEWPSLLGAIGSKTPRLPTPPPPPPPLQVPPSYQEVVTPGSSVPINAFGADDALGECARAGGGEAATELVVATAVTTNVKEMPLSVSPPRSSFLREAPSISQSTLAEQPPPMQATVYFATAPLPGTCRREGVEVGHRLRERAWLLGTRSWGEPKQEDSGRRHGQKLGGTFERDSVGSMFPLDMVLQTSFLAHSSKAPVTSMATDPRSESILLTGSGEGEVRVWSIRDHPVVRLSGFRSGDSPGTSRRRRATFSSYLPRAAVSQLGFFEGAARAAALDGLVRVWDVERSKGLAICHQGIAADAPPLTAFSLAGCGNGTTSPLDHCEWDEIGLDSSTDSAADDQQITATYDGGVVHYDCRQGRLGSAIQKLFPVARWNIEARLESLRASSSSKSQTHGSRRDPLNSSRRVNPAPLPPGLCSVCEGEGEWLAAGSGGGQVVVFDKRRSGGRPLFWWNAHGGAVAGVFHVGRHLLLTTSRDRTAVLWDLSRSPAEMSSFDSTVPMRHHPTWSAGSYRDEAALPTLGSFLEMPPVRVSSTFGLPDSPPGMSPASVLMLPLAQPRSPDDKARTARSAGFEPFMFGAGQGRRWEEKERRGGRGKLPVLFATAGDKMVATVIRQDTKEAEVHPAGFVGPSGRPVTGKSSGRRSSSGGGLAIRSAVVLPLHRLVLLGCADGWVRVGT